MNLRTLDGYDLIPINLRIVMCKQPQSYKFAIRLRRKLEAVESTKEIIEDLIYWERNRGAI